MNFSKDDINKIYLKLINLPDFLNSFYNSELVKKYFLGLYDKTMYTIFNKLFNNKSELNKETIIQNYINKIDELKEKLNKIIISKSALEC